MLINTIFIICAYCVGSLSSAIIVCKCWGLADPRTKGSNNPGATNVLRLGGKVPAVVTLLGDAAKGFIPTLLASTYLQDSWLIAGIMLAAFVGHIFPIFFGFRGGKGVATAFGAYFGLSLPVGACIFAVWAGVIWITRLSSLGAVCAALFAPIIGWVFLHNIAIACSMTFITIVLLIRHKANLYRLWFGKETKI